MARRPVVEAAVERFRENRPIVAAVVEGLRNAAINPNNTLAERDIPIVAAAVQDAMARDPVVQNATNQEAWWKSRVWVGIITAAFGVVLARLQIQFTPNEQALVNQITPYVPQILGLAIAAVGRSVGNRRGPIQWLKPWTILGIPADPFRR